MSNEMGAAASYILTTLTADGTLSGIVSARIFADFAPQQTQGGQQVYPCVIFSEQSSLPDSMGAGAVRLLAKPLFFVRVIGRGGYGDISDAADRIDALLHQGGATVTISGTDYFIQSFRVRPFQRSEPDDGVRYSTRGGFYRLLIQQVET